MANLSIRDLPENTLLDRKAMERIHGGNAWLAGLGPVANVNIGISQNIVQMQNVEVNALNNVGVIGAGFTAPQFAVNPSQWANASTEL